jgi:hypothetical protein
VAVYGKVDLTTDCSMAQLPKNKIAASNGKTGFFIIVPKYIKYLRIGAITGSIGIFTGRTVSKYSEILRK